jgi:hypothetical protein
MPLGVELVRGRRRGHGARALELGVGPAQAIILGAVTGVGGGTVRDVLIRQVPSVLSNGLYAIPALVGAGLVVGATSGGVQHVLGAPVALRCGRGLLPDPDGRSAFRPGRTETARGWARGVCSVKR